MEARTFELLKLALPHVSGFVDKLRNINVVGLLKEETEQFLHIVETYERIIGRTSLFISDQRPIYEKILQRLEENSSKNYEILYNKLDFATARNIFEHVVDVHSSISSLSQTVGSRRWSVLKNTLILGSLSLALIFGGIAVGVAALTGAIVAGISTKLFAAFSFLSGLGVFFDTVEDSVHNSKIKKVEDELEIFKKHIKDLKDSINNLHEDLGKFKLNLELGDDVLKSNLYDIINNMKSIKKIIDDK